VSKTRVAEHGEVYTNPREVNAMLDLVKLETERIESRFLEPACGTGNFLIEILARKLGVVEARYGRSQLEFERYAVLAVSTVYGIDILEDNVSECRRRLSQVFDEKYIHLYKKRIKEECRQAARYILEKNIIHGDALTLKTVGPNPEPIMFSEWSPVNGNMLKRRDFIFRELLPAHTKEQRSLFSDLGLPLFSDTGSDVFIPSPVREYPLVHFLRVFDAQ